MLRRAAVVALLRTVAPELGRHGFRVGDKVLIAQISEAEDRRLDGTGLAESLAEFRFEQETCAAERQPITPTDYAPGTDNDAADE